MRPPARYLQYASQLKGASRMPISVTCGCGKALRVKDEWAGRTVTCPGCGGTFVVGATGGKVAGAARGAEVWSGGRKSRG